jgi:hypothetical protein
VELSSKEREMTQATIPSRTSEQTYTVVLHDDGSTTCTCTAGTFGKPCWHTKALRLAATEELARREATAASAAEHAQTVAGIERFISTCFAKAANNPCDASRYHALIRKAEADLIALAGK